MKMPLLCHWFSPLVLASFSVLPAQTVAPSVSHPAVPGSEKNPAAARLSSSYAKLPVSFEANKGQSPATVQYLAHGQGYNLFLTPSEMVLSLHAASPSALKVGQKSQHPADLHGKEAAHRSLPASAAIRMRLIGSNEQARGVGEESLPGKSNYFIGNDRAQWHTDIPTFAKVRYSGVYAGIDLVYYGNQDGLLEHDFVVAPGANPNQISLDLGDRQAASLGHDGSLLIPTKVGTVTLRRPVVYQTVGGHQSQVSAEYAMSGEHRVGFRLGNYDRSAPLIIDPVLDYASVFGGSRQDEGVSLAVDSEGEVYVAGVTYDNNFPTVDPYQSTWTSSTSDFSTGYISKLNASGTELLYSTYIGGTGLSGVSQIALDPSGRIYVSGYTAGGFPVKNAAQPNYGGGPDDAFIAVLSPAGNSLEWSTYLGGSNNDYANTIALDEAGNVYASGFTYGSFPALHSIEPTGVEGSWAAKFNSSGALQYSSVVGGFVVMAMAVDANGAAYIGGYGFSAGGPVTPPAPVTPGAFRSRCATVYGCAYVAKINPAGDSLAYATFLTYYISGVYGMALDSDDNAYIGGTTGPGLPVWSSGFQTKFGGGEYDAFVAKLNATGTDFIWSTYLGGNGDDEVYSLALDRHRQVFVDGFTCSSNFPLKDPIQTYTSNPAPYNCQFFVTTLSGNLGYIPYYSTYFGTGFVGNGPIEVVLDPSDNAYLAGTSVGNIHPTPGAFADEHSGVDQVFVAKLSIMDDLALAMNASPNPVAQGGTLTYNIAVTSKGPDLGTNVRIVDTLPAGTTFVSYNAGGGSCTAPAVGATGNFNCALPQLNPGVTWNVTLTVHVNAAAGTTLSNTAATMSNMEDSMISNSSSTVKTGVN